MEAPTVDHELFWISGSPYAWRVQLALGYKGVPYASRRMDSARQENRSPAFIELNPRGKVPVLKTGNVALYESVAIIAFLDRAHPAVPLFGQTVKEHGHIWQRVSEFENYTRDMLDVEIVRPLLRGYAKDDPGAMRASAARVYDALGWMEQALSIAPYLAGNDITAADIVALPNIQMLRRVAVRPQAIEMALGLETLDAHLPALGAWLSRMEAMRGYDAAYPPHWRI
ncbi:glutathione S-transferase family protein [Aurantimonas endophytica]|uniref:Glutathione S-transferase n=1 Tax=Aurantimonas endophytica TaxID=1522175 RepID=A0A7W6MNX3_9HYPH|nr:glutathione S-transferase family protein [Aurantimonas endophytica]MBB4002358.1 glutathione S-transferase [Aurantimonas endophytica]MCO6402018.1 glutathione S-transferase family protein [Aurantimonas endophytica]